MQRLLCLVLTIALCFVSNSAFADLTVDDRGWEITVSSPDGRTFTRKDSGYVVKATGRDVSQGIAMANQKAATQREELNKAMDTIVVSGLLSAPLRPALTRISPQPAALPLPAPPAPRTAPACTPPPGGRLVTLEATWTGNGMFTAYAEGRVRTFFVPKAARGQYAHQPPTLNGWLYNDPFKTRCTLTFRDASTCVDIQDP